MSPQLVSSPREGSQFNPTQAGHLLKHSVFRSCWFSRRIGSDHRHRPYNFTFRERQIYKTLGVSQVTHKDGPIDLVRQALREKLMQFSQGFGVTTQHQAPRRIPVETMGDLGIGTPS